MNIFGKNSNTASKSGKRKGKALSLILFLICGSIVVLTIIFDSNIRSLFTYPGYDLYSKIMGFIFFLGLLSLVIFLIFTFLTSGKIFKVISALILIVILLPIIIYLIGIRPHKIKGNSMNPNIINNEFVFSSLLSYRFGLPQRGDVVIFSIPNDDQNSDWIGRVVGMPNEYISIRDGRVYINNQILVEPYLTANTITNSGKFITETNVAIPNDQYVILGDNRENSFDSRYYGFIKVGAIRLKVLFAYWPTNRLGLLKTELPHLEEKSQTATNKFTTTPPATQTCSTLNTVMLTDGAGRGVIGCDVQFEGQIDLSKSYCEGQKTRNRMLLIPDAYQRPNRYYATLGGLDINEEVKVFVYTLSGTKIECLPSLNR